MHPESLLVQKSKKACLSSCISKLLLREMSHQCGVADSSMEGQSRRVTECTDPRESHPSTGQISHCRCFLPTLDKVLTSRFCVLHRLLWLRDVWKGNFALMHFCFGLNSIKGWQQKAAASLHCGTLGLEIPLKIKTHIITNLQTPTDTRGS